MPIALIASVSIASGCAYLGMVDDGTSVSRGMSNDGRLLNPAELPVDGDGYRVPPRWARRGLRYGTDELVSLIVRVGRRVSRDSPGAVFGVADLSPATGGRSAWHRSHQTGLDADIVLFAVDADGKPVRPEVMHHYRDDGSAEPVIGPDGKPLPTVYFDVERNWLLVRALVEDDVADLQYLFLYEPLEQLMLDHARAIGEPPALIETAAALLHQPTDSLPHNDHLHVRIYCPPSDRAIGCRDRGNLRWKKKGYKYEPGRAVDDPLPAELHGWAMALPVRTVLMGGRGL